VAIFVPVVDMVRELRLEVVVNASVVNVYRALSWIARREQYCFTVSVRLRPFVRYCPLPVLCLNECAYRQSPFWRSGRGNIVVFRAHRRFKIPMGPQLAEGVKYPGMGNIAIFDQNHRLSRKRDMPTVTSDY